MTAAGEVAEWSKAQHWKCCIGATLSRVRIPPSPSRFTKTGLSAGLFLLLRGEAQRRTTDQALLEPDHSFQMKITDQFATG